MTLELEQKQQEIMGILKDVCEFLEVSFQEENVSWMELNNRLYLEGSLGEIIGGKIYQTIQIENMTFYLSDPPSEIKKWFVQLIVGSWD